MKNAIGKNNTFSTNERDVNLRKALLALSKKPDKISLAVAFFADKDIIHGWLKKK